MRLLTLHNQQMLTVKCAYSNDGAQTSDEILCIQSEQSIKLIQKNQLKIKK